MLQNSSSDRVAYLETAFDAILDCVVVVDIEATLMFSNNAGQQLLGVPENSEATAAKWRISKLELSHSDGRSIPVEGTPTMRALRGEVVSDFEVIIARPEGGHLNMSVSARPVNDGQGKVTGAVTVFRDVTGVRNAEKEVSRLEAEQRQYSKRMGRLTEELQLRASELTTIFENTDAQLVLLDRNFNFVMANSAYAEGSGKTSEDLLSHNHFDLFPNAENKAIFEKARDSGEVVKVRARPFIYTAQPWRGVTYWDWSLVPVKDQSGNVHGLVFSLADVTKEVESQQEKERLLNEVEAQRQMFQLVFENVTAGIAVLRGPDFVVDLVNPAFQAIAPAKKMLGKGLAEVWPEIPPRVLARLEHVLGTGETYRASDILFRIRRSPGGALEEAYFMLACMPLATLEGGVDSLLVLAIETTEQVQVKKRIEELAETAHRRASEKETIVHSIADAVYVFDENGRVVDVNQAGLELIRLKSKGDAFRQGIDHLRVLDLRKLDGSPIDNEEAVLTRALKGEIIRDFEELARDRTTGLDVYFLASAAPIRDSEGRITGAVVILSDISQLRELDRLKDQFISIAAHELKTPVTIMKGYAQSLLRSSESLPSSHRRVLEAIDRGADRIDGVVNELLDVSRLQLGQLELLVERIDLPDLVEQVIDRMALTVYKHQIELVGAMPVVIFGDRGRLEQVVINLINNAVVFSPAGGSVHLEVSLDDQEAVVLVRDYGVGIPIEEQEHIFERFHRAHAGTPFDYGGMGVGLYISKEIVTRHGGRMWFESTAGKGSSFYFSLPVVNANVLGRAPTKTTASST